MNWFIWIAANLIWFSHPGKHQCHGQNAQSNARTDVGGGVQPFAFAHQRPCIQTEAGEGGKAAEKTGNQQQPQFGVERSQALDGNGEYANGGAAEDIDQQRSPRKANRIVWRSPAHGRIAHEVAGDGAECTAQSDQKYGE